MGKDPVYYLNIPFIYDFISCAWAYNPSLMNVVILSIDFPGTDDVSV